MTRPKLLDLFCGAVVLNWSNDNNHLSPLRDRVRIAAADQEVLLSGLLEPRHLGGHEDSSVSSLRQGLPSVWRWRCQPAALLKRVRQESCSQDDKGLDGRTTRGDEAVQRQSCGERSDSVDAEARARTVEDPRASRISVCRLWRHEPTLVACRLHRRIERTPVPPSSASCLRPNTSNRVPSALCESPLRADLERSHRRNRHHSVAGRP